MHYARLLSGLCWYARKVLTCLTKIDILKEICHNPERAFVLWVCVFDTGEYGLVLVFFLFAAVLSSLFAVLPVFLARRRDYMEKLVPYECGFDQKNKVGAVFDIKFCIVGILFVIFDVEVVFLFPWSVCLGEIGSAGYWSMLCFLGVLTIGFIYEWNSGALEWE